MPLQIPHPTTPLHLYRHLLRESTYLPALCRPWITSRIQQRFRDCRHGSPPERYVKQAHSYLQYLRSANAGHVARLERLCHMATGRVGKRRRILATSQLGRRPPIDTAELESSRIENIVENTVKNTIEPPPAAHASNTKAATDAAAPTSPGHSHGHNHDWLDNWSLDMVTALAQSQVNQQARDWPQTMRRTLNPKSILEGTNCFGRPYKPRLIRNKLKKHWAAVLHQLLPPLPQGEWDHLASLVRGEANMDELIIPQRRPVARSTQESALGLATESWDWSQHVLKPARVVERGGTRRHKTLTGKEDQDPRGPGRPIGVRVITPQKLQRIYVRVWNMSPVMKQNPSNQKWSVSWGEHNEKISTASTRHLVFFQGVTKQGRVLPKSRPLSEG